MKVGIFDPYLDDLGGGEKYMATIAECLSKEHDVTVFWDERNDLQELLKRFNIDLSKVSVGQNIFSPQVSFIKRIYETRLYDAMIFLSDGSIPFSLSKKLFVHFQAPMEHIKATSFKTKLKISRVNQFFCNAYFTKRYIDREFGVKSIVIYPPVTIRPKNPKKENMILHVGRFRAKNVDVRRLVDYKKQDIMVAVFKEMVDGGFRGWRFVLAVGVKEEDLPKFRQLQDVVKGYPIEFFVNRTNEELWELYSKAKIYWHASGFGEDLEKYPERAEHFGISTVEAMGAGGVPVVINAGGQPEIVTDGVNGFLWDTLDELKERTLFLVRNDKEREKLAKSAKERAKDFNKERFCREIYGLIEA